MLSMGGLLLRSLDQTREEAVGWGCSTRKRALSTARAESLSWRRRHDVRGEQMEVSRVLDGQGSQSAAPIRQYVPVQMTVMPRDRVGRRVLVSGEMEDGQTV